MAGLLAFHAHPDDESSSMGGVLAQKLAASFRRPPDRFAEPLCCENVPVLRRGLPGGTVGLPSGCPEVVAVVAPGQRTPEDLGERPAEIDVERTPQGVQPS